MRRSRMVAITGAVALATTALGATAATAGHATAAHRRERPPTGRRGPPGPRQKGGLRRRARPHPAGAGATVTETAIGLVTVTSTDAAVRGKARGLAGVKGAADRTVGRAPA